MPFSRRDFIRMGCCSAASFGVTAAFGHLNLIHAFAAGPATEYQALVCIFLFGGNDANNMIIPNDTAGYANYATVRSNLAIPQASLLPIVAKTGKVAYGLHPELTGLAGLVQLRQGGISCECGHAGAADHAARNTRQAGPFSP